MFVIWSGFGFLALLVPIVTVLATTALANASSGPLYSTLHHWPATLGALLGAGAVYLISMRLNANGRTLVDPATGQSVVLRRKHTLFWLPLQLWAAIIAIVGLVYLVLPPSAAGAGTTTGQARGIAAQHICA